MTQARVEALPRTVADLRGYAIARTFFTQTLLSRAIEKLGFVQADPIRAPARAQDLTLRQRVADYRAGDLERRYSTLPIEEDFFVNYGFVVRGLHHLMHPREPRIRWTKSRERHAAAVLEFVRERGVVHPREVDGQFAYGKALNWFGGSSNASTQLLDQMHYRGLLRVARRESGIRLYSARDAEPAPADPRAAHDALVDAIVAKYAPLPAATLGQLLSLLGGGVPQWRGERAAALTRAKARLTHWRIDGLDWYAPAGERLRRREPEDRVRLLAPFDPLVWDRRRFELFWGWAYRFEAYTPAPKRRLGYYALPLLWRDEVIGWANATARDGVLDVRCGYVAGGAPPDVAFRRELDAEIERLRAFVAPRRGRRNDGDDAAER